MSEIITQPDEPVSTKQQCASLNDEFESLLRLAAAVGELMLSNGAEISRVEDTISRILQTLQYESVDAFAVPSGVFVSAVGIGGRVITAVRRVKHRTLNLDKICLVNNLSRRIVEGTITLEDAVITLEKINAHPPYPLFVKTPAIGVACFSFTYMLGGTIPSAICAFIVSAAAYLLNDFMGRKKISGVLCTLLTSTFIAACAAVVNHTGLIQLDKVIIGGIMQLVPGLGLTNAIRDASEGNYMSAVSRLLDALLIAIAIATGIGIVLRLWMFFFGSV